MIPDKVLNQKKHVPGIREISPFLFYISLFKKRYPWLYITMYKNWRTVEHYVSLLAKLNHDCASEQQSCVLMLDQQISTAHFSARRYGHFWHKGPFSLLTPQAALL